MHQSLESVRRRVEEAMISFASTRSLPAEALRLHRHDEPALLPELDAVQPFVAYRQTDDVDLEALYRELGGF